MKKAKRNALVSAVLAIALCLSVIAGATFALFTSKSSVNIAITSGNVEVTATATELKVYLPKAVSEDGIADATDASDGESTFANGGTATLDGNTVTLKNMTPGDKASFKITVKNESTVAVKYRTRLEVLSDEGLFSALKIDIGGFSGMNITPWQNLAADVRDVAEFECSVELPASATSEYKNKTCAIAYTVEATQGNAETANDTAYYTLAEFNALTEIPEEVTNVYVTAGNISVVGASKCATIGNYDLSDQYVWVKDGEVAPEGFTATERRDARNESTAYRSNKRGYTVHVLGSLTMENYSNGNFSGFQTLCFLLPEQATVILDGMTLNGSFNISGSYSYLYNAPDGSVGKGGNYTNVWYGYPFVIENLQLKDCTINGQWFDNGNIAKNVDINGCTFNDYNNVGNANWANPIWWKNAGKTNLTIVDCDVTSTRPMKVGEGGIGNVTVINNKFTMLAGDKYTADTADKVKTTALCFGNRINGDVVVSGNEVNADATALISLLDVAMTMPAGKTFTLADNTVNGIPKIVKWKDTAEITPSFLG